MIFTRKYDIAVVLGVIGLAALAIVTAFGAQEPRRALVPIEPPSHSPDRVGPIAIIPVIGMDGRCSHMAVTATICVIDAPPSGPRVTHEIGEVTFDLCVTDHELAHKLVAAALLAWKQGPTVEPSQLPTNAAPEPPRPHRRALRSQ